MLKRSALISVERLHHDDLAVLDRTRRRTPRNRRDFCASLEHVERRAVVPRYGCRLHDCSRTRNLAALKRGLPYGGQSLKFKHILFSSKCFVK